MRKSLILSLVLLFFAGCSKNSNIPTQPDQNGKGKILLKIDSGNKPENVIEVDAYLTREGYDTLSASLNLESDTTADVTISDIAAGDWHLTVNALDSSSVIVYTGGTDVTILAGVTAQIYLTLNPTGNGFGNIYIHVGWGTPQNTNWTDYTNNPILSPQNNYWDYDGVAQGKILYDEGIYKMWYLGLADAGVAHVGYAESTDGISWTRPYSNPVLSPGDYGSWDAESVGPGAIIKENGTYKLYYVGWADQYSNWNIGLATSTDGINWTKYPGNPILYGTSGWEFQIVPTSILKVNGTYYLYYFGRNYPEYKIGLATSTDGINWTKYSGNPILVPTVTWEMTGVLNPTVINDNGTFKMIYSNAAPGTAFGMATSTDGINWTKDTNNPIFENQNTSNGWGAGQIGYPYLMKLNNEYRVYYSGTLPNSQIYRIGFMSKAIN